MATEQQPNTPNTDYPHLCAVARETLPATSLKYFLSVYEDGLTQAETAERYGVSKAAISRSIMRARQLLQIKYGLVDERVRRIT